MNLVENNQGLVAKFVDTYGTNLVRTNVINYNLQLEREDLLQMGNMGLLKAVEKYDPNHEKHARFGTYAVFWIKCYLQRYVHEQQSIIRIPQHVKINPYRII